MPKPFRDLAKVSLTFDFEGEIFTVIRSDSLVTKVETYDGQLIDVDTCDLKLAKLPQAV